jgi:hypothetical protein
MAETPCELQSPDDNLAAFFFGKCLPFRKGVSGSISLDF